MQTAPLSFSPRSSDSTRDTHAQTTLTLNPGSASATPVKKKDAIARKNLNTKSEPTFSQTQQTDDSGPTKGSESSFELFWRDDGRNEHQIYVSSDIISRLARSFTFPSSNEEFFAAYLKTYLMNKYKDAQTGEYPYTVPSEFYRLGKKIAGVTHELFAGAKNWSGVCANFCSGSVDDMQFGSQGPWESVEGKFMAAAGHPPRETRFIRKLISTCESNMLSSRPYYRILIPPAKEDGDIDEVLYSENFNGEIIATIHVDLLSEFRHQLEFFRDGCSALPRSEETKSKDPLCIAVWVNDTYRREKPLLQMLSNASCYVHGVVLKVWKSSIGKRFVELFRITRARRH